jgi:glycosyltransferase involved in cell wall biosynthesis
MEIIHIALGKVNPNRMNGVNKVVFNLALEQVKAGIDVQVWGISNSLEHNYPERNFTTVLFKKKANPFAIPDSFVDALINSKPSTIFHIHGGFIPVFYCISKLMQKFNRKFIFTPHGSYNRIALRKNGFLKRIYFNLFELKMLKNASLVHVLGKSESEGLDEISSELEVHRVPYGFELSSTIYQNENSINESYTIGFCGRIDIYTKGLDVLLNAFAVFLESNSNAKLWIIGDGIERQKLENKAKKLKIFNSVVFYGSRYGNEKNELIAQLDLFVHPSRNEGLPTAVLEASSMGIPCLISEATNLGDEVRASNSGVVIAHTNNTEMLEGIKACYEAFSKTSINELRNNSKQMVTDYFNWNKIIADFNSIYNRALSK